MSNLNEPPKQIPESAEPNKAPPAEVPESLRRKALKRPSLAVILGQAFRDFVGKDVQQTTTYSYVWSADQGGHFMLGFVPTFVLYWACVLVHETFHVTLYAGEYGMLYTAAVVMTAWTALELYDLYDSISKIRRSTGYFVANTLNLIWNVVTALFYFSLGAFVASMSAFGPGHALAAFVGLFFVQVPMAMWWLRIKIIFQQAGLPYLYRLPNYDGRFDVGDTRVAPTRTDPAVQQVVTFINGMRERPANVMKTDTSEPVTRRHLIVSGPRNSGKTSLGVGIGTEYAFNGGIGRYITMSELAQIVGTRAAQGMSPAAAAGWAPSWPLWHPHGSLPSQRGRTAAPDDNEFNDGRILWRWASVDLLIIDDVVELLLPARRALESRLQGDGFRQEVEAEVFQNHKHLVDLLGGPDRAKKILDETIGEIQSRLQVLASPEVVAKYVAESFTEVLGVIKKIPRVVWVLGDMILPNLFESFIRKEFDFSGDKAGNLLALKLLPPQAKDTTGQG